MIELSVEEARRLNHHYIGTEHLLLGLLAEGEGIAVGVLEGLGVSLQDVRRQIVQVDRPRWHVRGHRGMVMGPAGVPAPAPLGEPLHVLPIAQTQVAGDYMSRSSRWSPTPMAS